MIRLILILLLSLPAHAVEWMDLALRLTGESDSIRSKALRDLKDLPNLKLLLKEALEGEAGKEQSLALDVVAALSIDDFVPLLLGRAKDDADGRFHLTVNALLHSGNRLKIAKHYQQVLKEEAPNIVKVIALDTLGRMEFNLPRDEIEALLKSPHYEVRSAALAYVRALLIRIPRKEDLALLAIPLSGKPFQLRVQAIQAIKDLPPSLEIDGLFLLETCRNDPHPEVLKACGGKT